MIQLTLTLKMTTAEVVETTVTGNNTSIQECVHPDDPVAAAWLVHSALGIKSSKKMGY